MLLTRIFRLGQMRTSHYRAEVMNRHPTTWLNHLLGWVYPNICQICRTAQATAGDGYVCADCSAGVRFIQAPFCERCGLPYDGDIQTTFECTNCRELKLHFDSARSAVLAKGVVLEIIHRYKYQQALWFEVFLANLLTQHVTRNLSAADWDYVLPVPLHPVREREREFNQAHRLAARLSQTTNIPMNSRLLRRMRATSTQTQLSRDERSDNMRNAFAVRPGESADGLNLVIVDDVFTTGATTSGCAKVLKAAGARQVCVWTVARGV